MITHVVMQCVNLFNTSISQENFKSEYQSIFYNFVVQIILIPLHWNQPPAHNFDAN